MSLVTPVRYQQITRDLSTAEFEVTAAIATATDLLEEELQRGLEQAARTERMYPDPNGRLYPKVTPLVTPPPGLLIDGDTLYATGPFAGFPNFIFEGNWADLTYTAGYVERTANPTADNRLPAHVEQDLAAAAYVLLHKSLPASLTPAGVAMVRLGDAIVNYGTNQPPAGVDVLLGQCWSKRTLRLRRARRRL